MPFIVTGTPRAATKYAARLLSACGVPCVHEGVVRPLTSIVDVLRWFADAEGGESSWMAWTVLPLLPSGSTVPVLHTIRDPWLVIDSLTNRNSIFKDGQMHTTTMRAIRDTINTYATRVWRQRERVDRAACMVVDWHDAIRRACPNRVEYRVDRLTPEQLSGLTRHIGYERTPSECEAALAKVKTNTNAGYTINDTKGISDPVVRDWIKKYAAEVGASEIVTRRVKNVADRETPEQLAARMSPRLLEKVNHYAATHGYRVVQPAAA